MAPSGEPDQGTPGHFAGDQADDGADQGAGDRPCPGELERGAEAVVPAAPSVVRLCAHAAPCARFWKTAPTVSMISRAACSAVSWPGPS